MPESLELNRALYKKIKSMDKDQMSAFLTDIYKSANEAHKGAIDLDKVKEEVGKIKGIGENRLNEIMSAIERCIIGKSEDNENA